MVNHRTFFFLWTPLIAYCGLIVYVSSIPAHDLSLPSFSGMDKFLHVCEYSVVGALFARAWVHSPWTTGARGRGGLYAAFFFAALFGISDEWHQSFVSGRYCSGWDIMADSMGGVLGAFIYLKWRKRSFHD